MKKKLSNGKVEYQIVNNVSSRTLWIGGVMLIPGQNSLLSADVDKIVHNLDRMDEVENSRGSGHLRAMIKITPLKSHAAGKIDINEATPEHELVAQVGEILDLKTLEMFCESFPDPDNLPKAIERAVNIKMQELENFDARVEAKRKKSNNQ